jgi:hypothetical protein
MKPLEQLSPFCLVLVFALFIALSTTLAAAPVAVDSPISPTLPSNPVLAIAANRTNVVRIAALGMVLALFIMYRTKY